MSSMELHGKDNIKIVMIPNLSLEKSPSNRARCIKCGKKIGKDEPRLCESWSDNKGRLLKEYTCWKCKDETVDSLIRTLEMKKSEFKTIQNKMNQELQKDEVKKILLANELIRNANPI